MNDPTNRSGRNRPFGLSGLFACVLAPTALHGGLVAHYHCEEAATPLVDQSGGETAAEAGTGHLYQQASAPAGTYGAITLTGSLGKAVGIEGAANGSWNLSPADSAELGNLVNNFTVMSWVYIPPGSIGDDWARTIGDDVPFDSDAWNLGVRNKVGITNAVAFVSNGIRSYYSPNGTVVEGAWQHIAATKSATTGVTLFHNGIHVAQFSEPQDLAPLNAGNDIFGLGRSNADLDAVVNEGMLMDEVRVHDSVLDAAAIIAAAEDGQVAPPVPGAPGFTSNPVVKPDANALQPYTGQSLAGDVSDSDTPPENLVFAKVNGPDWLGVAADGSLGGTPQPGDSGANSWTVSVSDGANSDSATLLITVTAPTGDTDEDGLEDAWELAYGLDPNDDGSVNPDNGRWGDPDGDGLPNDEEQFLETSPVDPADPDGRPWQPRPEKARLMIISCHPDDEGIFFGGAYPYYTRVRKLPAVGISMTSNDSIREPPVREGYMRDAVWYYGLRNQPIFPRFFNSPTSTLGQTWASWSPDGTDPVAGRALAGETLAYWMRRYRPDVVITHDFDGEYGHNNHKATALATADAVPIAADPAIDLSGLPPWQVKKLYVHEYGTNPLFHDHWNEVSIDGDGDGTPDQTPIDRTNAGLLFHLNAAYPAASTVHAAGEVPANREDHPGEWWGLYYSAVGPDTVQPDFIAPNQVNVPTTYSGWARGDFFENLIAFADEDYDMIPDDWELAHYPSVAAALPGADDDGDGSDTTAEFMAGLDPHVADRIDLSMNDAAWEVNFTLPAATGPGYDGLERRYRLLFSPNLEDWSTVVMEGIADGSPVSCPMPTGLTKGFYRLAVWVDLGNGAVPRLAAVDVRNHGIPGANTNDALANLPSVLAGQPDRLVVFFGINDSLNSSKLVSLPTCRQNLTNLVTQAEAAGVKSVLLATIHPVNTTYLAERHPSHPELTRLQDHVADYDQVVREVAATTGAALIDWRARFLAESPGTTVDDAVADTADCLLRCEANSPDRDGVHLTAQGNAFLADEVAAALRPLVEGGDVIACFGDSVTYGSHMTGEGTVTGETYPAFLASEMRMTE